MNNKQCRICNNSTNNRVYQVSEMMFGFRDRFDYFQCSKCHCLQICEFPPYISKYYPQNYYSYSPDFNQIPIDRLKALAQEAVAFYFAGTKVTRHSRVLDIGSGSGSYVYALKEIGFTNILGIDPYLDRDIEYENGAKVRKDTIYSIDREWDLIMFNHSFEHLPDPLETLRAVSRLLSREGICLIRMPTVPSYAWEKYGVYWVHLDAPRHFFLLSDKSLTMLAEKSGLRLKNVVYDSTEFQFWASEQYMRGIPLSSDRSYGRNPANSIFSPEEIEIFKNKAQQLNLERRGDCAAFYLAKNSIAGEGVPD